MWNMQSCWFFSCVKPFEIIFVASLNLTDVIQIVPQL